MASVNTGLYCRLEVTATKLAEDAALNRSLWRLVGRLIEHTASATYNVGGVSYSLVASGNLVGTLASGSFTFDFRSSGLQSVTIVQIDVWVDHNPDGSGAFTVTLNMGATSTSGAGGPTSVSQAVALPTLTVPPNTPTGLTAQRVSDSQADLSWGGSHPSNGQPTVIDIQHRINGGSPVDVASISPATSASVATAANRKTEYRVRARNSAGASGWSAWSAPIFTTPAAPSGVAASKDSNGDIVVGWTPHAAYSEHQHVIEHGVVVGGSPVWDGSPIATIASGTSTWKHENPDPSDVHVYRVWARSTDTGALESSKVASNSVQLLAPPNPPTWGTVPAYADKAADLVLPWTHNPVDTTGQTAFELRWSEDGGDSWNTTGKTTSGDQFYTISASTYAADVSIVVQVRTWGQATSGGSDGAGASDWSAQKTVTFKTAPTLAILSPADEGTYEQAELVVVLDFDQAEGASFVSATLRLYDAADALLEELATTTLAGTAFETEVENGATYKLTAQALDSNGLLSAIAEAEFEVDYTDPVTAVVDVVYDELSGVAQIMVTVPEPDEGEAAAASLRITRDIAGARETVVPQRVIAAGSYTFLDTTPTIAGLNTYRVTTFSADGASSVAVATLETEERRWAFLNTGDGFERVVRVFGDLAVDAKAGREQALVRAAGRSKPIALFGEGTTLEVSGKATLVPGEGSSPEEVEAFLLGAGLVCHRDPSGRRVFGAIAGRVSGRDGTKAEFAWTVTEAT